MMRTCQCEEAGGTTGERKIEDVADLAEIMTEATYHTWIEGLGSPSCISDLRMWHEIGKFLQTVSESLEPA